MGFTHTQDREGRARDTPFTKPLRPMIKLTPTADHTTFNEGEFFTAKHNGRRRTFEFIGKEGDHLISYLIDERTKDGERTDVIEHKPTEHFNA